MRRPKSRYHIRLTVAEQAALAQEQYPRALVEADKREKHERLTREVFRQIEQERQRQISKGYDADHDDAHVCGEIAKAAACYAIAGLGDQVKRKWLWPWEEAAFKDEGRLKNLVKAAALLVAEIERCERISEERGDGMVAAHKR